MRPLFAGHVTGKDEIVIRSTATALAIPCYTTMSSAATVVNAREAYKARDLDVRALQDYHAKR